jgi:hypothetical protein
VVPLLALELLWSELEMAGGGAAAASSNKLEVFEEDLHRSMSSRSGHHGGGRSQGWRDLEILGCSSKLLLVKFLSNGKMSPLLRLAKGATSRLEVRCSEISSSS